jgi:hypothetical protein
MLAALKNRCTLSLFTTPIYHTSYVPVRRNGIQNIRQNISALMFICLYVQ